MFCTTRFMPSKNPAQRLRDIIDNIDAVAAFTAIAAAGNVYRHEYKAVDEALIWHTAQHDLAALRSVAAAELDRSESAP